MQAHKKFKLEMETSRVKEKGTIATSVYYFGTKFIYVLCVFEIDQSVLTIGKLIEKGYKVLFEN